MRLFEGGGVYSKGAFIRRGGGLFGRGVYLGEAFVSKSQYEGGVYSRR